MGTLGGGLGNCSHVSDLVHVMAALEAELEVRVLQLVCLLLQARGQWESR